MTASSASAVPSVELSSGRRIPQIGLGTYLLTGEDARRTVEEALTIGYRHFDTAAFYGNERAIGAALAASGIPRSELYVTTKVWQTEHGRDRTRASVLRSISDLGLDYIDLILIHWPAPAQDRYLETWESLEEAQQEGTVRDIGVSNFQPEHLERVLALGGATPVVNQIELHPRFQQADVRAWQETRGIRTQAWGPLGQGRYRLDDIETLRRRARRLDSSVSQVAIAWLLHEGVIVIPKTSRRVRMIENLAAASLALSDADLLAIREIDRGLRLGVHPNDHN